MNAKVSAKARTKVGQIIKVIGVAAALMPLLLDGPERTRQIADLARVREALEGRTAEDPIHSPGRDSGPGSGLNSAIGHVANAAVALLVASAK